MELIYIALGFASIIFIFYIVGKGLLHIGGEASEAIGRVFFNDDALRRIGWFLSVGIILGVFLGYYTSSSGTPSGLGKCVLESLVVCVFLSLVIVTVVNAIYAIFRLDKEKGQRYRYTEKQREKDLKAIAETKAEAAAIYARCSATPSKTWHTGY